MEKRIKTLYILSIAAIIAFIGMQVYWLYARYEYSITEYEDATYKTISDALTEYNAHRASHSTVTREEMRIESKYNMNYDVDSAGNPKRIVTVTTRNLNGRKLLGIKENRELTPEELKMLEKIIVDSLDMVDEKMAKVDASNAPSDGVAWNAMRNFETEIRSPFTVEGIDSTLKKWNVHADISLIVQDSVTWDPISLHHSSLISPNFKVISSYSELERKAVVIQCRIPLSEIIRDMGWTLAIACILSLFLIACLIWQIKTIVKLTRLDKMRNMFVSTMIHELKRPISTLKMCISGFDNDKLMSDSLLRKELTAETRIALDNLSAYFSKLRDITFNDVEQIPLNVTSFSLASLVDSVLKSITIPGIKHVEYECRIAPDIQVSADRSHLTNILTNLIENAIKYSGDEVRIIISAKTSPDGIEITVADNGNGIPAADKGKIFNRFYRGKASASDIPGMGLGLAYVKLLTDAHGGEIYVESNEGVGSTFTIKLPQ